jgi:Helicase associated domain
MSSSLISSDGLSKTKDCGNEGTAPAATPMLSEEQSLAIESLMCMKQQIRSSAHVSAHPVQSMSTIYPPMPPLGPSEQVQSMSTIYPPVPPLGPSEQELNEATTARAKAALISWYQRLKELYDFKLKYGHTDVPQKYSDNRCLGIWINKQR